MRRGASTALLVILVMTGACDRDRTRGPILPPRTLEDFVERSEANRGRKRIDQLITGFPAGSRDRFAESYRRAPGSFLFLHGVHSLSRGQARVLATFDGDHIVLPDVMRLGTEAARALSRWNGESLFLDGLAHLDPVAALALSEFHGELISLSGLQNLSEAAAAALARFRGSIAVRVSPPEEREETR